jgi:type I restriction enzyme S subunit
MSITLPSTQIQRKIAAILSAYDDLIENNNRRIKVLEEMAERIYREWFVDFRYPGHENVPLVDSELGQIPRGWSVCCLEDVAKVMRGLSWERGQEVESGGLPIITIPNVQERLHLDDMTRLEGTDESTVVRFSLAYGDTVLVGSNGNPERVGQAVFIPPGAEVLFASFLMRVRADQSVIGTALLHMQLKDPRLTSAWRSSAIGSTSLRNIRLSTLKASPVLLAEAAVQALGELQLREVLDLQDAIDKQSALLRTTRDLLLPRLISGEIDVTDLDIAEPEAAA